MKEIKNHEDRKYMCQMIGREREKLRFKCLNSDRDEKITKRLEYKRRRRKLYRQMNFFVPKRGIKYDLSFPTTLPFCRYIYDDETSEIGLDSLLQYLPVSTVFT
jgi:hypothetical protein